MHNGLCLTERIVWLLMVIGLAVISKSPFADVIRDGSIGPGSSIQPGGPNFEIPESMGELRGGNLFHSFQDFSLTQNQSATFSGTSPIDAIIGRVTGPNVSNIDGLLRSTVPGADLYLMNPRGIMFGPNASLDIQGAFHASTAEGLNFANGDVFSADAAAPPILSVAPPDAFGFLGAAAGAIELNGSILVSPHDIALSGGTVALNDGALIGTITNGPKAGGDIVLTARERVSLSGRRSDNGSAILATFTEGEGGGGAIRIEAPVVELLDGAFAEASTKGSGSGGALSVTATDRLMLSGTNNRGFGSLLGVGVIGEGEGGKLSIEAPVIELQDGAFITTSTEGLGNGGALSVTATDRLMLSGTNSEGSPSALQSGTSGEGEGGSIQVEAPMIELQYGAAIGTLTTGFGNGGALSVTATDRLILSRPNDNGSSSILQAITLGEGEGGKLSIEAPVIELLDGAFITTRTEGSGNGGALSVTATDRLMLSGNNGKGISSNLQATTFGEGEGGTIQVHAPIIELLDGTRILNNTRGSGNAGALSVTATDRLMLSGTDDRGSGSTLQAGTFGEGEGGTLRIEAPVVEFLDGALIINSTRGSGNAGALSVTATDRLILSGTNDRGFGSTLTTGVIGEGEGEGGKLSIKAPVIELLDGAFISTNTEGSGNGGALSMTATDRLILSGTNGNGRGSSLRATTFGESKGGTLRVEAPVIELLDGAFISTNTEGSGNGGALSVTATDRLMLSGNNGKGIGSNLQAATFGEGEGGTLSIKAPVISLTDNASIQSESQGTGNAGSITVSAEEGLYLADDSAISTEAQSASGGNITIGAGNLISLSDSTMSTNVGSGSGRGGDIVIAPDVVVLNRSSITAQATAGRGGDIQINAKHLLRSPDSVINASAGLTGIDGKITTPSLEADLASDLARPKTVYLDSAALLRPSCEARNGQGAEGHFRVAQQRGLPLSPEDVLLAFDPVKVAPRVSTTTEEQDSTLTTAAMTAFRGGQFEHASQYWAQASQNAAEKGDTQAQGDALRALAQSQLARGHYGASLEALHSALAQAVTAQDPLRIAAALGQLGNAYLALGDAETAEQLLNEAIERVNITQDDTLAATLLNNLGNLYMVQRHYDTALNAYETSAQRAQQSGAAELQAKALSNGARAALEREQYHHATELLTQARRSLQTITAGHDKAAVLIHLAKSSQLLAGFRPDDKQTHFAAAYKNLRAAVMLSSNLEDQRMLSYALGNLGYLYQHDQRTEEALYLTRLAQHAAEQANAPESLYRWHWQAGQLLWKQDKSDAALQAYRRAVVILEDSRQETLAQYGAAHVRFRQAVAPVYLDLVDALLQHSTQFDDPTALLLEARDTVEQLKAAELRDYFLDECVTELEAKATRLDAVSPHAAVIYPIILPQRLELLVSLPTGLQRYTVAVDAATLNRASHDFRSLVETQASNALIRTAARQLYTWLVKPYADELGTIDTLVFVPDGALRTIPIAALHDGTDFLIHRYSVVITPGLSLIDPRPLDRDKANFLLAGLSESVQEFPALPAVPSELHAVQQLHGGRILLDNNFTVAQLKEALDTPVSVLHIASHAQFTGEADSSFLLTYDGRLSMDQLDQTLGVTRFRDKPLELLVLSACQTAAGDERAALGLAGVGIKAGARSALGSLWAISDTATAELITEFYRQLKSPKVTKAQALQAAQQVLLADARFAHPFYWSPYLLINNWL